MHYFTGSLPCLRSRCPRSSSQALHPELSDGLTCSASWLWLPCGVRVWERVFSLPCLCDPCRGVQPGKNAAARTSGPNRNSLGSAQSQNCLCGEQDAVSFLLAHHQTGYVWKDLNEINKVRWNKHLSQEHRLRVLEIPGCGLTSITKTTNYLSIPVCEWDANQPTS